MRRILLLLLFTVPVFAQTNEFELPKGSLTLTQARRIALDNNSGVSRAFKNIDAAQAVLKQIKSIKYPTATVAGRYNMTDVSMQPEWAPDTRYNDSFNDYGGGIAARWLLFDGFARRANILSSKYGVEQSEKLHIEAQRLLLDAVTTAYIQSQMALEAMAVSAQDLSFNRTLESDSAIRYRAGVIPESELLNFSVRALRSEISFMQSKRNYNIACLVLAQLMELPDINKLSLDMQPMRYTGMPISELPLFDELFGYAVKHRPDLLAIDAQCRILEQQVRAKKGSYSPKISVVGGVNYSGRNGMEIPLDINNRDSYIGVAASWELFSAGRRKGDVSEAVAHLGMMRESYNEASLRIQSGIRQALETATVAHDTYQRSRKAYDLTTRIRTSVEKSYKAGATSITRLNEAQTDLTRAAGAAAFSRIAYLQALESLASETGRILENM